MVGVDEGEMGRWRIEVGHDRERALVEPGMFA
jgi:hypothetical protein